MLSRKTDGCPEAFQGEWMIPLGESEHWATQRLRIFSGCSSTFRLMCNSVLFWFGVFKVILICTTLGEGGKIAERNELASLREMAGLGLRQQALVCVSLSLNTYSSGVRSRGERIQNRHPRGSAHCLSLPLPCFYLPEQPEAENIINYAECFFPLLFKVSCWTSQGTCLDKLRPGVLINLKVSTLGSQVNIFPLGHLGLAEP